MKFYQLHELYEGVENETNPAKLQRFIDDKAILDYIDNSESEHSLIAMDTETYENNEVSKESKYTHCEIHNSFIFGMMSNLIIFPENNPGVRNSFSCGQSKQAVSVYHTNYFNRVDKTGIVLNYGQSPLVKTKYLEHFKEENCYGVNTIVAIGCYGGYNVEDSILFNEGSIKRGMFNTTYFNMYEAREESSKVSGTIVDSKFMNIDNISVEIRNDLLSNKKKIDKWSKILKIGFKSI